MHVSAPLKKYFLKKQTLKKVTYADKFQSPIRPFANNLHWSWYDSVGVRQSPKRLL